MDNTLTPDPRDILVEEALHTYPMAAMPRDITAEVLACLPAASAPRPFRLGWMDLALAVVLALCAGALWFSVQSLPPIVVAQIRKESILFYQFLLVNARWLFPAVCFAFGAALSALTLPYLRAELTKKGV